MPQHLRRAKQAKARLKNRVSIHSLPPNVLENIFAQAQLIRAIDHENFTISKLLLYYALNALYRQVDLFSRSQAAHFLSSLLTRPRLARQVEEVRISRTKECDCCRGKDLGWRNTMNEGERLELEQMRQKFGHSSIPYDSFPPPLQPQTLRLIFAILPNLKDICIFTKLFIHVLFDETYLSTLVFSKVQAVSLDYQKKPFAESERSLCHRLQTYLPILDWFEIYGAGGGMPCGEAEEGEDVCLPQNSWKLSTFRWFHGYFLEESCYDLFLSFASSTLRHVVLHSIVVDEDLPFYLGGLPRELETLALRLGPAICDDEHFPDTALPIFDKALHDFRRLKNLELDGTIVTSSFLSTLPMFRSLEYLSLGYHIPIDGSILVDQLRDPTVLPSLEYLQVLICHCPRPGVEICLPRWTESFRWTHASQINRAARKRGITVGGNLTCSIIACDRSDGHECFRVMDGVREAGSEDREGSSEEL